MNVNSLHIWISFLILLSLETVLVVLVHNTECDDSTDMASQADCSGSNPYPSAQPKYMGNRNVSISARDHLWVVLESASRSTFALPVIVLSDLQQPPRALK